MAKKLLIHWYRYLYTDDTTIGKMFFEYVRDYIHNPVIVSKDFFGYTLEDTVRGKNIKVMECTAIPADIEMRVSKFHNDHYGDTLILYTEDDGITIKVDLLRWVGCLFHNGNNKDHTAGCVLVGATRTSNKTISDGLKAKLAEFIYEKMKEGYEIYALATNEPQLQ
jgi:hypothetical protein